MNKITSFNCFFKLHIETRKMSFKTKLDVTREIKEVEEREHFTHIDAIFLIPDFFTVTCVPMSFAVYSRVYKILKAYIAGD